MSESLGVAVDVEEISIGSQPSTKLAFAMAAPTPASPTTGLERQALARLLLVLESEALCAAPPEDVLDLLISTALFAKAIMQLDRDDSCRQSELQCYDALASLKGSLRRVAWSRALE